MPPDNAASLPSPKEQELLKPSDIIKKSGAAYIQSKLQPQLFTENWQEAQPNENDNDIADRGPIGCNIPVDKRGLPYSPEPLGSAIQFLNSYHSPKTKDTNQIILSAPIDANSAFNQNLLNNKFNSPFREIGLNIIIKHEGYTTRRGGPNAPDELRIKLFLPDQEALNLFETLTVSPSHITDLIHELWPGTQMITIPNIVDIAKYTLSANPTSFNEARDVLLKPQSN